MSDVKHTPSPLPRNVPRLAGMFPRRSCIDLLTPEERLVYDAIVAIERMPVCDVRLTSAQTKLAEARDLLADVLEGAPLLTEEDCNCTCPENWYSSTHHPSCAVLRMGQAIPEPLLRVAQAARGVSELVRRDEFMLSTTMRRAHDALGFAVTAWDAYQPTGGVKNTVESDQAVVDRLVAENMPKATTKRVIEHRSANATVHDAFDCACIECVTHEADVADRGGMVPRDSGQPDLFEPIRTALGALQVDSPRLANPAFDALYEVERRMADVRSSDDPTELRLLRELEAEFRHSTNNRKREIDSILRRLNELRGVK